MSTVGQPMAGGRGLGVAGQAGMNYPKLLPVNKVVSQYFTVVKGKDNSYGSSVRILFHCVQRVGRGQKVKICDCETMFL